MRKSLAILATLSWLTALPSAGETAMTAAEFEAYSVNKTLTYAYDGEIFGTEQYLPNRRVRWAFTQEECREGYWFEDAGLICFVYEDNDVPQCWRFFNSDNGLRARFSNDPASTELSEVEQTSGPLICAGPQVGV